MPATLTTKERPRVKVLPERRPPDYTDLKKNIVLFMLGASMTLFAFWLYGGHSCTADIIRDSTPRHVFHQEYYGAGAS